MPYQCLWLKYFFSLTRHDTQPPNNVPITAPIEQAMQYVRKAPPTRREKTINGQQR